MNLNSVAAFFAAQAAQPRLVVSVETPHGDFHLRKPTALEVDQAEGAFAASRETGSEPLSYSACLVAACLCDAEGNLVYADQDAGRRILSDVPAEVIAPLARQAGPLAGLGAAAKERLEKNGDASDGDATCASPSLSDSPPGG